MTLSDYDRLKAYWWNPRVKKVEFRLRTTKRFTTHYHQESILRRLEEAKAKLNGSHELSKVPSTGEANAA